VFGESMSELDNLKIWKLSIQLLAFRKSQIVNPKSYIVNPKSALRGFFYAYIQRI
jgi:hypothetical protein